MNIEIKEIPKIWVKDEIKRQETALNTLLNNEQHFKKVSSYIQVIEMTKEFLGIARKKLEEIERAEVIN